MYHMPISDELAIKLNADRILNFLSETLSVPNEVRDLLRKAQIGRASCRERV